MQISLVQSRTLQCLPLRWARTNGDRSFKWPHSPPARSQGRAGIIVGDAPATWQDLSPRATAGNEIIATAHSTLFSPIVASRRRTSASAPTRTLHAASTQGKSASIKTACRASREKPKNSALIGRWLPFSWFGSRSRSADLARETRIFVAYSPNALGIYD